MSNVVMSVMWWRMSPHKTDGQARKTTCLAEKCIDVKVGKWKINVSCKPDKLQCILQLSTEAVTSPSRLLNNAVNNSNCLHVHLDFYQWQPQWLLHCTHVTL